MLDIGGSHGYYSVALCRRHPSLRAVILDLSEAVTHAERILDREGMGDRVISPTATAVLALLEETDCEIAGKEAVVVGTSDVVGKPITILLMDQLATVTACNVKTKNLKDQIQKS